MKLRDRLTYANVAATLALVIAVAGGTAAVAGVRIAPKNSVVTKSIRANNVTATDVTRLIEVRGQTSFNDPAPADGTFGGSTAVANCPPRTRVISGGGFVSNDRAHLSGSGPGHENWFLTARGDGTNETTITAIAWCLSNKAQRP